MARKPSIKTKVWDFLDIHGDVSRTELANFSEANNINFITATWAQTMWKQRKRARALLAAQVTE